MSEFDRYVKAIQDVLAPLGSPADRLRALQEVLARTASAGARTAPSSHTAAPPAGSAPAGSAQTASAPASENRETETRRPAANFFTSLSAMPDHMRDIQRILGDFSQPAPQLRQFQEQLSTTRQQLQLMANQLEATESMVARVAELAEHFAALQQPFIDAAVVWTGAGTADTRRETQ